MQMTCIIIFCRNSVNVEGATHKQVIDVIRSSGDTLSLTGRAITDLSLIRM